MLSHLSESALLLLASASFLIVIEAGFRLGRRRMARGDEAGRTHITALQNALLALMSLLLGFNFASAASRFDARKALIQDEVNAIATSWQRAHLLPAPHGDEIGRMLQRYVDSRIAYMRAGDDPARIEAATEQTSLVDRQLWQRARELAAEGNAGPQLAPWLVSLSDLSNVRWKRRAAIDNHVPAPVVDLLFAVALGALGFMAYGYGLTGRRRHGSTAIFALFIALVLTTILDLDRPRDGLVRVTEDELLRLQASLASPF